MLSLPRPLQQFLTTLSTATLALVFTFTVPAPQMFVHSGGESTVSFAGKPRGPQGIFPNPEPDDACQCGW